MRVHAQIDRFEQLVEEKREFGAWTEACEKFIDDVAACVQILLVDGALLLKQFRLEQFDDHGQHGFTIFFLQLRDDRFGFLPL